MMIRHSIMAVVVALVGIGWAIRLVPEQAPPPAPPAVEQTHPKGPGFLDDYEHWLRTGDLPTQTPVHTDDPLGAPFK